MRPIVLVVGYRRPEYLKQVLEVAVSSGLRVFVSLDRARDQSRSDSNACLETRQVAQSCSGIAEIWEYPEALGCGKHVFQAISRAFEISEKVIILEDDTLPSASFFSYCERYLEDYKDDEEIGTICGSRLIPRSVLPGLFASHWPVIWGWASWRRVWRLHSPSVVVPHIDALVDALPAGFVYQFAEWIHAELLRIQRGQLDTWDIQFAYNQVMQRRLSIYPELNLITNIGIPDQSATNIKTWSHILYRQRHEIEGTYYYKQLDAPRGVFRADRWYSEWICGDSRSRFCQGRYPAVDTQSQQQVLAPHGLGIKGLSLLLCDQISRKISAGAKMFLP